ncbi:MAG TPA: hypothetical protein VIW80_14670 [Pyrinomonadaceae bacterium]
MMRSESEIQNLKSKMDMEGRIEACRRRLRRTRAMQRAAASYDATEPEASAGAPLMRSIDGPRPGVEAETISHAVPSPVNWIEDGARPEVDRRPPPRARFSTEEETVRA